MKELCPQFAGFVKLTVSFFCVSNLSPEDRVLRLIETRINPGAFLKGERIRFEEVRDHDRRTACRYSGMNPVQAILEYITALRRKAQLFGCAKKNVRGRLARPETAANSQTERMYNNALLPRPGE